MLQGEHSAILLTFIKLPFVTKIFVLSIFEWSFYTGFTVECFVSSNFMHLLLQIGDILFYIFSHAIVHATHLNIAGLHLFWGHSVSK